MDFSSLLPRPPVPPVKSISWEIYFKVTNMNLQAYRELKDISVKKASEELGISRQHIYDIEKGKAFPSRKLSVKISRWSGGLITQGELLFSDLQKSVHEESQVAL